MRCADLATVNWQQLRALTVLWPFLPEQCRIITYLGNLQVRVGAAKHQQAATAFNALLPSVLDRTFRREL
jgi:hypothetical protein